MFLRRLGRCGTVRQQHDVALIVDMFTRYRHAHANYHNRTNASSDSTATYIRFLQRVLFLMRQCALRQHARTDSTLSSGTTSATASQQMSFTARYASGYKMNAKYSFGYLPLTSTLDRKWIAACHHTGLESP